jgi:hypothetical protein
LPLSLPTMTCTLSPRTILQLSGEGNMGFMAFRGLLGIVTVSIYEVGGMSSWRSSWLIC